MKDINFLTLFVFIGSFAVFPVLGLLIWRLLKGFRERQASKKRVPAFERYYEEGNIPKSVIDKLYQ